MVEVDASNTGVGAVLSPVEQNYDVGNRELLAVVLALQEWRDWFEGAQHPFIVWTDHKNFSYFRAARRLKACQARWALFLGRFRGVCGGDHTASFVCWVLPVGRWRIRSKRHNVTILPQTYAQQTNFSFLHLPVLLCSPGGIPPRLPVTRPSTGPWHSSSNVSGGPPSPLIPGSLFLPALSVPATRPPIVLWQVFYNLSPYLARPGLT